MEDPILSRVWGWSSQLPALGRGPHERMHGWLITASGAKAPAGTCPFLRLRQVERKSPSQKQELAKRAFCGVHSKAAEMQGPPPLAPGGSPTPCSGQPCKPRPAPGLWAPSPGCFWERCYPGPLCVAAPLPHASSLHGSLGSAEFPRSQGPTSPSPHPRCTSGSCPWPAVLGWMPVHTQSLDGCQSLPLALGGENAPRSLHSAHWRALA